MRRTASPTAPIETRDATALPALPAAGAPVCPGCEAVPLDRRGGGLDGCGGGKGGRRSSGVGRLRAHAAAGTEGLDSNRALLREHWGPKKVIGGSQGRLVGDETGRTWADLGVVSAHAIGALLQKSDVAVGARAFNVCLDVVLVVGRAGLRAVDVSSLVEERCRLRHAR